MMIAKYKHFAWLEGQFSQKIKLYISQKSQYSTIWPFVSDIECLLKKDILYYFKYDFIYMMVICQWCMRTEPCLMYFLF